MSDNPFPSRKDFLRPFHVVGNLARVILVDAVLVAGFAFGPALLPMPAYVLGMVLLCIIHQRHMSEWLHEASHVNFLPSRAWNDAVGDALFGIFLGSRVRDNRIGHLRHHAETSYFTDEDAETTIHRARSRADMLKGFVRDISGMTAVSYFLYKQQSARDETARNGVNGWLWLGILSVLHGAGFALLAYLGRWDVYLIYFGTLLTLYPVLNRFRVYGQHAEFAPDGKGARLEGSETSRTMRGGFIEWLIFNSDLMAYHHEHHRAPALPFRALPGLHQGEQHPNKVGRGCIPVVFRLYRSLP